MDFLRNLFGKKKSPVADMEIGKSRISQVRLFVEPPAYLANASFDVTGLPKDFISTADKELMLEGRLVNFIKEHGDGIRIEKISRMNDAESQAYFSRLDKSGTWKLYYGSGASGARYSVFVKF
jgi:hypothetical protein